MRTPISIVEMNGDVATYGSIEAAEMDMEPIDVERGEYVATDADGRRLIINVVVEEVPLFWGFWKARVKKVRLFDEGM